MDTKFNPPLTKAEFLERAKKVELKAALSIRNALLHRRASAVRALDIEIEFYDKVVELYEDGEDAVEWPVKKPEAK